MNAIIISKKNMRVAERGVALTNAEALKLSAMGESIVMDTAETPEGYHLMYNDGTIRQYDPVTNTIVGPYTEPHWRNGWVS